MRNNYLVIIIYLYYVKTRITNFFKERRLVYQSAFETDLVGEIKRGGYLLSLGGSNIAHSSQDV